MEEIFWDEKKKRIELLRNEILELITKNIELRNAKNILISNIAELDNCSIKKNLVNNFGDDIVNKLYKQTSNIENLISELK